MVDKLRVRVSIPEKAPEIFSLKFTKYRLAAWLRSARTREGKLKRSPDPLATIRGVSGLFVPLTIRTTDFSYHVDHSYHGPF